MKLKEVSGIIMIVAAFALSTFNAQAAPLSLAETNCNSEPWGTKLSNAEVPNFDVRVCFNGGLISICVTLSCHLHWSDAILPGAGQLFGDYGCHLKGSIASGNSTPTVFEGTSEDMIKAIETAMKLPPGGLKQFTVVSASVFTLPDGKDYRVTPKTYPVVRDDSGRYLPLEFEPVQ